MRIALVLLAFPLVAGCIHEEDEEVQAPHVVVVTQAPQVIVQAAPAAAAEPVEAPRRRLDHVVTLGEATYEPYVEGGSGGNAGGGGTNITINNNVGGGDPGYYGGYYGGYGYGGYGYGSRGHYGRGTRVGGAEVGTAAQAAPVRAGQTPGVGGNWPTIPSHGPRQAR